MANFSQKFSAFKESVAAGFAKLGQGMLGQILPLILILAVIVAGLAGVLGYNLGERAGKKQASIITNHKGEVISLEEIKTLQLENELLKNEVATLIQERDISINNLNLVRETNHELKANYQEVNALNEALARADPNDDKPAQVLEMAIYAIGSNVFEYNFDVLIVSTSDKRLEPRLTLLNATNLVEIPLTPNEFNTKGMVKIQGKFAMPTGFNPSQLKLTLNIDGQNIVKFYDWQVQNP